MSDLSFLPSIIDFEDGLVFERLDPITDFRVNHEGSPAESRILYLCRESPSTNRHETAILKVKVQIPDTALLSTPPAVGPSDTSTAEIKALQMFRESETLFAPHLIASKTVPDTNPMLPGGYITYSVMSRLPGQSLLALGYWSMTVEKRQIIQTKFLEALEGVRKVGIEPGDKGLRNVLWHADSQRCSLVDFELWTPFSGITPEDEVELQTWGLASRPPSRNWWAEFGIKTA
ncbi:hypothetical protein B0A48_02127 [Cryoendolithus antarcticus]|uniref:Aminoglycoside phosphotransferase domain-containing protein n=1 Tax=Cryoendolithus antarcticus TaxID=1507870 RepID=A0A1V8TMY1_9PEZI|nr:hypothetical protein B0A48_02127 [Cryoendolithus antarcticus]